MKQHEVAINSHYLTTEPVAIRPAGVAEAARPAPSARGADRFDTPGPITADIEPGNGFVTIVARDRVDTVVTVRPANPVNRSDRDAAEHTTVDLTGTTLRIRGPKLHPLSWSSKTRSIDVTVALPTGSDVHGKSGLGDLTATGRLGDVRYRTELGHVRFDEAATLSVASATGNVVGNRVAGAATITTGSGRLQVGELAAGGVLKNANGTTVIGAARGPVRARATNGDITVEEATAAVEARTSYGAVRVLDAVRGALTLETEVGEIEVGIHEGSVAWLDVEARYGTVRNGLTTCEPPTGEADRVEIHADTAYGDVTVRRA